MDLRNWLGLKNPKIKPLPRADRVPDGIEK
jgi:hypothetical protein